mmetsp:Transcript_62840/g.168657  ORF Transcript_62840/g.168657 Transcript_62840/m.168657 type:complete len:207 (-) Transcript_62840:534-1154(-)
MRRWANLHRHQAEGSGCPWWSGFRGHRTCIRFLDPCLSRSSAIPTRRPPPSLRPSLPTAGPGCSQRRPGPDPRRKGMGLRVSRSPISIGLRRTSMPTAKVRMTLRCSRLGWTTVGGVFARCSWTIDLMPAYDGCRLRRAPLLPHGITPLTARRFQPSTSQRFWYQSKRRRSLPQPPPTSINVTVPKHSIIHETLLFVMLQGGRPST